MTDGKLLCKYYFLLGTFIPFLQNYSTCLKTEVERGGKDCDLFRRKGGYGYSGAYKIYNET